MCSKECLPISYKVTILVSQRIGMRICWVMVSSVPGQVNSGKKCGHLRNLPYMVALFIKLNAFSEEQNQIPYGIVDRVTLNRW